MRAVPAHLIHLGLLGLALGVSYWIPFDLVLLSYAVLGPLHYLTEIAWLHERAYFLPNRAVAGAMLALGLVVTLGASAQWLGLTLWLMFAGAGVYVGAGTWRGRGLAVLGVTVLSAALWPEMGALGVLIPTVIHVCVFTLVFMLTGAVRSRDPWQRGLVCAYLVSLGLLWWLPPQGAALPPEGATALRYFGHIGQALGAFLGQGGVRVDARFMGFLSFVYTYHYLNWFAKAGSIRWHRLPLRQLTVVVGVSVGATALYAVDYEAGFAVLLCLSAAHVILELPLDAVAVRDLGRSLSGGVRGLRTVGPGA